MHLYLKHNFQNLTSCSDNIPCQHHESGNNFYIGKNAKIDQFGGRTFAIVINEGA